MKIDDLPRANELSNRLVFLRELQKGTENTNWQRGQVLRLEVGKIGFPDDLVDQDRSSGVGHEPGHRP